MSRAGPSLADSQLTLDLPEWRWQFRVPVIETASNNHESTVHWPDLQADEPQPACQNSGLGARAQDIDWTAKELVGGFAAFRRPCTHEDCLQPLARQAREMGVEFDG